MSVQRLFALMFLEYLQCGTTAFIGIPPTTSTTPTTYQQQHTLLQPTLTTGTHSCSAASSFTNPFMTVSLPTPISISMGPIHYSWYEDADNNLIVVGQRKHMVRFRDEDGDDDLQQLMEIPYASFGYDGKVKLPPRPLPNRQPFRVLATETLPYPTTTGTEYLGDGSNNSRNGRLRRGMAWIERHLPRRSRRFG